MATFNEPLARIPPAKRGHLDSKIDSDIHLEEIGICWEGVRPYIGFSVAEEEAIKRDCIWVLKERGANRRNCVELPVLLSLAHVAQLEPFCLEKLLVGIVYSPRDNIIIVPKVVL